MLPYGYIYKITINNKDSSFDGCYYYGQSKYDKRYGQGEKHPLKVYFGSGRYIKKYIKHYGTFGLHKCLLCECRTLEELNKKENEYIGDLYITDAYKYGGKCLNLRAGGDMHGFSKETRQKLSLARKGYKMSQQQKEKYKIMFKGKNNPMYNKRFKDYMSEDDFSRYRNNMKKINMKKHWWNNGKINVFADNKPNGFVHGRLCIGRLGINQYNKDKYDE